MKEITLSDIEKLPEQVAELRREIEQLKAQLNGRNRERIDAREVARIMNMKTATVYKYATENKIPHHGDSHNRYYLRSEIEQWRDTRPSDNDVARWRVERGLV